MRISLACHSLICLSFCSCGQPEPSVTSDPALRQFLGVKTLRATYQAPPGEDHYVLKVLQFEDGKLVGHGGIVFGQFTATSKRLLDVELLWGEANGKHRVSLATPGSAGHFSGEFWRKLDGGLIYVNAQPPRDSFEGYRILGHAQSAIARDGKEDLVSYGGFTEALQRKKYVGALGLKMYKSREEAHKGE